MPTAAVPGHFDPGSENVANTSASCGVLQETMVAVCPFGSMHSPGLQREDRGLRVVDDHRLLEAVGERADDRDRAADDRHRRHQEPEARSARSCQRRLGPAASSTGSAMSTGSVMAISSVGSAGPQLRQILGLLGRSLGSGRRPRSRPQPRPRFRARFSRGRLSRFGAVGGPGRVHHLGRLVRRGLRRRFRRRLGFRCPGFRRRLGALRHRHRPRPGPRQILDYFSRQSLIRFGPGYPRPAGHRL